MKGVGDDVVCGVNRENQPLLMKNHPAFTLLGKSTRFVLFVFTFHLAGTAFAADSFPRLSDQGDYQGAKIDPKEPELSIEYPGAAINRGLSDGVALVSVAVDKEGRATAGSVKAVTTLVSELADGVRSVRRVAAE